MSPLSRHMPSMMRRALFVPMQSFVPFSTSATQRSSQVDCYISTINDAYTNLAIEEWLLRQTDPERYILYLWRNKSCVVVGRNQNPFQECNLRFMRSHNIPLVRRRSGGGAGPLVQDMGNSIYTIFMPRQAFSRRANADLVSRALQELDIPASVNDRHDIVVDGYKVSGSAYKIIGNRAYHHGTMLIDTDTDILKGCLSKKNMTNTGIVSKGVASVPSPVTNLREYSYTVDHQQFCEAVLAEFVHDYNDDIPVEPIILDESRIRELPEMVQVTKKELETWDWIYGQTPEFTNTADKEFDWGHVHAFIRSKHGIITESDLSTTSLGAHEVTVVSAISVALRGCRYSDQAVDDAIRKINQEIPGLINPENESIITDVATWLRNKF
ncbi:Biotin/lipoate A/B protein ligase [Apophysomyces ossiformis]|uniref:Putative lipoate-protein ligase A n=1 Tax=Apophysomyces ossiformis TaxID=679940 RepID=A0A8H7BN71_9FUNG|nr:Biotin/lipoate A/B protein ligase [Apophysomyces ossiformis]